MNTSIRLLTIGSLLGLAVTLNTQAAPKSDLKAEGDALVAQIGVTHDAVEQVLAKMRNTPLDQNEFTHPDFIAKMSGFNEKVEKAMVEFEATLKNDILKKARFWMTRLENIQKSTSYSEDQKKLLIQDQYRQAQVGFLDLSRKYQAAIYKVLSLEFPEVEIQFKSCKRDSYDHRFFNAFVDVTFPVENCSPFKGDAKFYYGNNEHDHYFKDCEGIQEYVKDYAFLFAHDFSELRDPVFKLAVKKGCFSSSCVALFSEHMASYITLIVESLNRPISFSSPGGELNITQLQANFRYTINYVSLQDGDTIGLPFDISEPDYRLALQKEKEQLRKYKMLELATLLMTPVGGWFSGWVCPKSVSEFKESLCKTEMGCLTDSETKELIQKIEGAEIHNKGSRVECLQGK